MWRRTPLLRNRRKRQEKAINSINEAASSLQQDYTRALRDIKKEAAQEAKEFRKQLEALNKKHVDLTELTRELGDQRKHNEVLEKQLHELLESFFNYKAGHLRGQLDTDHKDRKDFKREPHIKGDSHQDSQSFTLSCLGKTQEGGNTSFF